MAHGSREKALAYDRAYRERNREKLRAYHRAYQPQYRKRPGVAEKDRASSRLYAQRRFGIIKTEILRLYGGDDPKCVCCGESHFEFLTIDHRNGGGNEERNRVGWGNSFYKWLVEQAVDHEKYRILCYNCNCYRRSVYQNPICPHRR